MICPTRTNSARGTNSLEAGAELLRLAGAGAFLALEFFWRRARGLSSSEDDSSPDDSSSEDDMARAPISRPLLVVTGGFLQDAGQ